MKKILAPGIAIGVLCGLWLLVMGYTGWYKDPVLLNLFWMVIPIQLAVLLWGLKRTAAAGSGYWLQVGAGTLMSLVAGIILFGFSLMFTMVLFPQYFNELRTVQIDMLKQAGNADAEISAAIQATAGTQTPLVQALSGVLGTTATGFVASLLIGAFVREK